MKKILSILVLICLALTMQAQIGRHRGAFKPAQEASVTYATMNPADKNAGVTLSEGNLRVTSTSGGVRATISMTDANKFQCEVYMTTVGWHQLGIATSAWDLTANLGGSTSASMWQDDGNVEYNSSSLGNNGGSAATEIIGMTWNGPTQTLSFYRNGSLLGTTATVGSGSTWFFAYNGGGSASDVKFNFGQTAFTYPVGGFTGVF